METLPKLNTCPKAEPSAVVTGVNYRITVLTERLLRLEYCNEGCFEDRATQIVLDRKFAPCDFQVCEKETSLEITTRYLRLVYDRKEFSEEGLSIEITGIGTLRKWHYNSPPDSGGNFGGTTRTLDEVDGSCEIEPGLLSMDGWAVLDDSGSLLLDENGWIVPRDKEETDLYFFGYGQDCLGCLKDYYHLTGKPPMLPRYALGNWWSRYFEYTEDAIRSSWDGLNGKAYPSAWRLLTWIGI